MSGFTVHDVDNFERLKTLVGTAIVGSERGFVFRGYYCTPTAPANPSDPRGVTAGLVTGLERICRDIDDGSLTNALIREFAPTCAPLSGRRAVG